MHPVELLYAKNIIFRKEHILLQELTFLISVANLAYEKQVDVLWSGENGHWQILHARYCCSSGAGRELWQAHAVFSRTAGTDMPGTVRFALRCCVSGHEYWDNNNASDYTAAADCGVMARTGLLIQNIDFSDRLDSAQEFYPVTAAVHQSVEPREVFMLWTPDSWQSSRASACFFRRRHWEREWESAVPNPNAEGWSIWISHIPVKDRARIEYAIGCTTGTGTIWDNNLGFNYHAARARLKILTLNLHCYQEENQDEKLSRIAQAIDDCDVDVVCLQEVAENWNHGRGDWNSNAAKIINDRLRAPYHLYADWSHIGFGSYREGSAILSRYPFVLQDSGYVSSTQDAYSMHTRKVCMARVAVPSMGLVNIFSVHLSCWDSGFREQFENLRQWAARMHAGSGCATFLCGDFNVPAGSKGYRLAVEDYDDQLLSAGSGPKESGLQAAQGPAADERIDFIFLKKGSRLRAAAARELFTGRDYGNVSDHCGYCMEFEPVQDDA
jgi:maltose 6'-phosphate phosphatase